MTFSAVFKSFSVLNVLFSLMMLAYFMFVVAPLAADAGLIANTCAFHDLQTVKSAWMLFLFGAMMTIAFLIPLAPCLGNYIFEVSSETHGIIVTYGVHLSLYGPLIIFNLQLILFSLQLLQASECTSISPELYYTLNWYMALSFSTSMGHTIIALWQRQVIKLASRQHSLQLLGIPANTFESFACRTYTPSMLSSMEEDYTKECPICLATWETGDEVKITPCQHAFHQECLQTWLSNHETCAMCRCNLMPTAECPVAEPQAHGMEPLAYDMGILFSAPFAEV